MLALTFHFLLLLFLQVEKGSRHIFFFNFAFFTPIGRWDEEPPMASPTSSSVKLTLNDEITGDAGMGESGSGLADCD